jgi:hypothetical protein
LTAIIDLDPKARQRCCGTQIDWTLTAVSVVHISPLGDCHRDVAAAAATLTSICQSEFRKFRTQPLDKKEWGISISASHQNKDERALASRQVPDRSNVAQTHAKTPCRTRQTLVKIMFIARSSMVRSRKRVEARIIRYQARECARSIFVLCALVGKLCTIRG